jgi:hypothetical protein
MSTPLDILRLIAPEFASVSDEAALVWIGLAAESMAAPVEWGAVYAQALANHAAHLMARSGLIEGEVSSGLVSGGTVSSMTTGRESISFGGTGGVGQGQASNGVDDDLTTTRWGMRYKSLRDTRAARLPRVL